MMRGTRGWLPAAVLCLLAIAGPAHALRVATWNLLDYDTTPTPNTITARTGWFQTAVAGLNPDVIIVQELITSAARDTFLTDVLNAVQPGQWSESGYITNTQSAVFWKPAVVNMTALISFSDGGPRDVMSCWSKPVGYLNKNGTFRLYSMHLKAGTAPADQTTRNTECGNIRTYLNNLNITNYGPNFLLGGDTNFYGATEGGYQRLTESQSNNQGQGVDYLGALMPGTWHDVGGYAAYVTQCPCLSCPSIPNLTYSGGGMDDRFDIIFASNSMKDGSGVDVIGYTAYGQDGLHFNTDIVPNNMVVSADIAAALWRASDHLPVVAIVQLAAKLSTASQVDFGTVITGATAQQSLAISNIGVVPADSLRYSFTAPAGFGAPAGTFAQAAGVPATSRTLTMSTATPGYLGDTLRIATNDPDTLTKTVLLSGRVLRHAAASLDSLTVLLGDTLDFGDHPADSLADRTVKVFDQGYDAAQARLAVGAGALAGSSRFSLVGGFTPVLVAGTPAAWTVRFDTTGVTPDSTYRGTLTFSSADEALPGAQPQPDLVVNLRVRVTSATAGVPGGPPTALRFDPPRPNPSLGAFRFSFDLPMAAPVRLEVFDLSGRQVATVVAGDQDAGHHELRWDARGSSGVSAGLYFARFSTPGLERTARLVILP